MSRRYGNNYSGPRWAFASPPKAKVLHSPVFSDKPTIPTKSLCGISNPRNYIQGGPPTCKRCLSTLAKKESTS
jgi:hypothetical protein